MSSTSVDCSGRLHQSLGIFKEDLDGLLPIFYSTKLLLTAVAEREIVQCIKRYHLLQFFSSSALYTCPLTKASFSSLFLILFFQVLPRQVAFRRIFRVFA